MNTLILNKQIMKKPKFFCAECGSPNIEFKFWVNPNRAVVRVDKLEPATNPPEWEYDVYCNVCKVHVRYVEKTELNTDLDYFTQTNTDELERLQRQEHQIGDQNGSRED